MLRACKTHNDQCHQQTRVGFVFFLGFCEQCHKIVHVFNKQKCQNSEESTLLPFLKLVNIQFASYVFVSEQPLLWKGQLFPTLLLMQFGDKLALVGTLTAVVCGDGQTNGQSDDMNCM